MKKKLQQIKYIWVVKVWKKELLTSSKGSGTKTAIKTITHAIETKKISNRFDKPSQVTFCQQRAKAKKVPG